jgi:transcriptional regulator with XRE-family HTH domain
MKDSPQQIAFYKQLGANIRKNRQRLELSQDDLARSIGLTRTSLTNIENGRQHPPLHTFCDLVEQLKVDASALLPGRATPTEALDVKAMAGQQVRGENELAFISSGISFKNEEKPHGDTKKKNRGNGGNASS